MRAKMISDDNNLVRELWTNERHAKYLTQMEASFARKLSVLTHQRHLHREIPDGFDSTSDSRQRRTKRSNSTVDRTSGPLHATTIKARRRYAQPSTDSSQDQVVPEIGNSKSDN